MYKKKIKKRLRYGNQTNVIGNIHLEEAYSPFGKVLFFFCYHVTALYNALVSRDRKQWSHRRWPWNPHTSDQGNDVNEVAEELYECIHVAHPSFDRVNLPEFINLLENSVTEEEQCILDTYTPEIQSRP